MPRAGLPCVRRAPTVIFKPVNVTRSSLRNVCATLSINGRKSKSLFQLMSWSVRIPQPGCGACCGGALVQASLVMAGAVASIICATLGELSSSSSGLASGPAAVARAALDASAHAFVGGCAYTSFLVTAEPPCGMPARRLIMAFLAAGGASVLLDCDRFIEVGQIRLDASSVLGRQGFLHCVLFVMMAGMIAHGAELAVTQSAWPALGAVVRSQRQADGAAAASQSHTRMRECCWSQPSRATARRRAEAKTSPPWGLFWLVIVTGVAHTLRDAERRGLWLTPAFLGSFRTPPLSRPVVYVTQIWCGLCCGLVATFCCRCSAVRQHSAIRGASIPSQSHV